MASAIAPKRVRSGTYGELWLNNEQVAEVYSCQIKVNKNKEKISRCGGFVEGHKLMSTSITGSIGIYNATSRLIELQAADLQAGKDSIFTIISKLDDPDAVSVQRVQVTGVSFDDLTLADWEAATVGKITAAFTGEDFDILEY